MRPEGVTQRSERRLVVVQHESSVPPGSIKEVLDADGIDHLVFHAWSRDDWPSAGDLDALIVLGGTMNVDQTDAYPFLDRSLSLMSDALGSDTPTLGVCLGSQMMAKLLGEPIYRAEPRNALFSPLEFTREGLEDRVVAAFSDGVPVLQFHEDTYDVPDDAVALAMSAATGRSQAFRYKDTAYAVQFHFEVDLEIMRGWSRAIGPQAMKEDWGVSEEDLTREAEQHLAAQTRAGKELFRSFLQKVV